MKRILIPTDFSEASVNSIEYGLKMAAGHDVTVTVIHVIELYKYAAGTSESEIYTELSTNDRTAFIKKNAEEEFEKILNDLKQKTDKLPLCEIKVLSGDLLIELQKEVDKEDVIMTIIAAEKRGHIASTNYNILHKLSCPVMLIPQNAKAKPARSFIYAGSIVPTDIKAIKKLAEYLASSDSDLTVVTICSETLDFQQDLIIRGFQQLIRENVSYPRLKFVRQVDKVVIHGLETVSLNEKADVLVMLKKKKTLLTSIINKTNVERLAFNLAIPIMYYPELYLK